MIMNINNIPIILWILPLASALFIMMIGEQRFKGLAKYLVLFALILSLAYSFKLFNTIFDNKIINVWIGNWAPQKQWAFGINLEIDFFAYSMILLVLIISILGIIYLAASNKESEISLNKFYAAWLILTGSMIGFILSGDLFVMYIMQEAITISVVALVGLNNKNLKALNNGFKFLITSTLTSTFILIGISLIYIQIHTLNLAQISTLLHNNYKDISIYALAFIITGFLGKVFIYTKIDIADSYENVTAAIFFGVIKLVQFYGIIRIIFVIYSGSSIEKLRSIFLILGTFLVILGTIMTLIQKSLKKFVNYQLLIQTAYMFICFGIGLSYQKISGVMGILGILSYIIAYAIFSTLLLMSTGAIINNINSEDIKDFAGIYKKMPFTVIAFLIGVFSINGMPLFGGFLCKWFLYNSLSVEGFKWLSYTLIFTFIINLVSFIKVIIILFSAHLSKNINNIGYEKKVMLIPMIILSFISVFIGIKQETILEMVIYPASHSIFNFSYYINSAFSENYLENMLKDDAYELPQYFTEIGYDRIGAIKLFIVILLLALFIVSIINAGKIKERLLNIEKVKKVYDKYINNKFIEKYGKLKSKISNKNAINSLNNAKKRFVVFIQSINSDNIIVGKVKKYFMDMYVSLKENEFQVNDQVICIVTFFAVVSLYMFFKML